MSATSTQRRARWFLLSSLIVPVLIALVGLWALQPASVNSDTGQPNLNAAIVNQDDIVMTDIDGQQIPVAVGRLLVGQLVNSSTDGFSWSLTNAETAQQGLQSGKYSAVLTIPSNFSQAYISSLSDKPVQANVDIETDGAHSYVATVLARSMAANLTEQLGQAFTQQYINALLSGYSEMGKQLTAAADGQQALADGLGALSSAAAILPSASDQIAAGARDLAAANTSMTTGLGLLQSFSGAYLSGLAHLSELNALLRTQLDAGQYADAQQTLSEIDLTTVGLGAGGVLMTGGLTAAQYASGLISEGSNYLAYGTEQFAQGMPLLADGLTQATGGADAIAAGLKAGADALPSLTASQAEELATVAANPVTAHITTHPALPSVQSALGAIMMPIGLWLGALVLSLVYRPLQPRNLLSSASSPRLLVKAASPMIGLAAAQGLLVVVAASASGVNPVDHAGLFALVMAASISFALLHQGLAALAPRATWVISIGLLTLQVVASGVILPLSWSPAFIQFLGNVLPLSVAMRGAQSLITGSSVDALGSIVAVAVSGLVGLVFLAIAISRGRMASRIAASR
ncbi:MAG: hypothetical protein RLZZ52_635 [Actinomycetota bacterium]